MNSNIAEPLFVLISILHRNYMRPVEQHHSNFVTPLQLQTLMILQQKTTLPMTALANELTLTKQLVTPVIDKLVKKGLVQRESDSLDRRIIKVRLTSEGYDFLNSSREGVLNMLANNLKQLDNESLLRLNRALNETITILTKLESSDQKHSL